MAGSYKHCSSDDGSFRFELIENLRDAHEACEMMHFMISYLAGTDPLIQARRINEAQEAYFESKRPPHPDWWHKLHNLWTKAVGQPNYNKREWAEFEAVISKATSKP
jgi:hypothetical protein